MANTFVQIGSTVTVGAGGASTITFSSIPATYTDLQIVLSSRIAAASVVNIVYTSFNGDTTFGNYSHKFFQGDGTTPSSSSYSGSANTRFSGLDSGANSTTSTFSNNFIYIPNYTGSIEKYYSVDAVSENNATNSYQSFVGGRWSGTAAITSISLSDQSSTFAQHTTATLYGIKNS